MPKTRDAFAFRIIEYGNELHDRVKELNRQENHELAMELEKQAAELFSFFFKTNKVKSIEQLVNDCPKDFESLKQSVKELNKYLTRAVFLLDRINAHERRLNKILLKHVSNSEIGKRALVLTGKYLDVLAIVGKYVDIMKTINKKYEILLRPLFNEAIGVRLRLSRKKKKYTQEFVAESLGVTSNAYAHYEKGRREIPPLFIYRLADLLDVSTEYLLGT